MRSVSHRFVLKKLNRSKSPAVLEDIFSGLEVEQQEELAAVVAKQEGAVVLIAGPESLPVDWLADYEIGGTDSALVLQAVR